MEEIKKRKMEETGNGQVQFNSSLPSSFSSELSSSSSSSSMDELRFLLDPLSKPQLVDLLAKLYVSNLFLEGKKKRKKKKSPCFSFNFLRFFDKFFYFLELFVWGYCFYVL